MYKYKKHLPNWNRERGNFEWGNIKSSFILVTTGDHPIPLVCTHTHTHTHPGFHDNNS